MAEYSDLVVEVLEKKFSLLPIDRRLQILNNGRPTPSLSIEQSTKVRNNTCTRHFQNSLYEKTTWLCGSEELNKLFCWPCLLFSTGERTIWNKDGYNNLNNIHNAILKHTKSQSHIRSQLQCSTFKSSQRIDYALDQQRLISKREHNDKVKKNREILRRLIDITIHLAKQELPFRGHDESTSSSNRGNYIETMQLLADYDPFLKSHLTNSTVFQVS